MAIKIVRNAAGNCIHFRGTSNPVHFNACLSGEVDAVDNTLVNVVNDIQTAETGTTQYEFYNLPYTEFRDASGEVFADAQAVADYITVNGNVAAPEDINVGYKGVFDASGGFDPETIEDSIYDVDNAPVNGDWFFINVAGTIGSDVYVVNDIIKYSETTDTWNQVKNAFATVEEIEASALNRYDIHVDGDYTGTIRNGSSVHPYIDLNTAISASTAGQSILIKGTITAPLSTGTAFTLPHSLYFYGADECVIKFATYDATNGDLFKFEGTDYTQEFSFNNITMMNAGGYGLLIKKALKVAVEDCTLTNNGWNGTGLSTVAAAAGGVLGYDSTASELQAFYAGSNASNGGAMRIEEAPQVLIVGNTVTKNLRGIRVQDCGVGGAGFITRNQSTQNIESGIYLAIGSLSGCQNITVINNYSGYNSNNGMLIIGGLNNKLSQNEFNGNWNAGVCNWGSGNLTLRDCGLYDNNRSGFNGIGNVGDAKASIQINDPSTYYGTSFTQNEAARFFMEVLDTQVHYTGVGSNTVKVGFLIEAGVVAHPANEHNIINIDDVGFIGQDYAIDLSEVDITNMQLSVGDCRYQNIGIKAVRAPLAGKYSELPFSNHVTNVTSVDVVVDTLKMSISLREGVGGNVINTYSANELQGVIRGTEVDIIQRTSDKIQIRGLSYGDVYVNGVVAGNSLSSMNDTLNAAFQMDLVEYKEFLVSEVGMNGDSSSGGSLPAIANNWYVSYGASAGTQIQTATIGNTWRNHNPFYNGEALEKGHEFIWTHNPSYDYMIGLWGAAEAAQSGSNALQPSNWSQGFAFAATNTRFSQADSSGVTIEQSGNFAGYYGMANGQLALRFGQDGYLYLYEIVNGGYSLVGKSNSTIAGSSVMIQWASFNEGSFPVMTERTESWEIVHDFDSSQGGEWSNGLEESTIIRSRISVNPGEKLTLNMSYFGRSEKIGLGYTGASTGVVGAEDTLVTPLFYNTAEILKEPGAAEVNWTWNTSASGSYDPVGDRSDIGYDAGTTLGLISLRYNSDNSLELWHETNNELIATKKVDLDGSSFNVYVGANENNHTADRIPALTKYDMSAEEEGAYLTGWYYIESPDGEFYYPLFATQAEANHIDIVEGGTGTSHTHTFADDTYNSGSNTWYMPTTSGVHAGTSAPQGGIFGNSINVVWNEIPTADDSNYLPTFTNITYNVQESSAINVVYKAAGMTETFNITNVPAGYADDGFAIIGTAEDITNGYGQSVTHVINVTKANAFGSVQGTITINVKADLAGNEFTIVEDINNDIKFTQDNINNLDFNTVTFNAGSTYKFYMDHASMESGDGLEVVDADGNVVTGNDGLTMYGNPGTAGAYLEYVIPSDVAPGKYLRFYDNDTSGYYTDIPMIMAGSTYTAGVSGVTQLGPVANQTGTNSANAGVFGYFELDETIANGERVIFDGTFIKDLVDAAPYSSYNYIGPKNPNTFDADVVTNVSWYDGCNFMIYKAPNDTINIYMYKPGINRNITGISISDIEANVSLWFQITGNGDTIELGMTDDASNNNSETYIYSDWNDEKLSHTNSNLNITNADILFLSYNNLASEDTDLADIDWTGIDMVAIPTAAINYTPFTKALDFSGSNEYAKMTSSSLFVQPLQMGGLANLVDLGTSSQGSTSNHTSARPWATSVVFKADGNNSNQMIWNQGEGSSSGNDNIYLRLSAAGSLFFGWGREGSGYNECRIANQNISSSNWYGVAIAHNGVRLGGNNASAANLADCFTIYMMSSADSFATVGSNLSVTANWTSSGNRMDRTVAGDFTIGGRGSGKSFHGKVASVVVTPLVQDNNYNSSQFPEGTMVGADEAKMMITDPVQWVENYRSRLGSGNPGGLYRKSAERFATNYFTFANGYQHVQVWLMGDGTSDSYSNGVRNYINPSDQNYVKLQLNSMASNDIENVSIPGLT